MGLLQLSIAFSNPLWAQVNISGKAGLMYIPSAELIEDGTFSLGYTYNPVNYAIKYNSTANYDRKNSESIYFINLVLLPRLEVNVNLLLPNGPARINDPAGYAAEGIGDRQIDLKYVLMTEKKKRPSVAVILSEPFGVSLNSLVTYALAATKHVAISKSINAGVTVGIGSPYSIYRAEDNLNNANIFSNFKWVDQRKQPYQYLSGPFGGLKLGFKQKGGLMVEWDSQHLNVGAYTTLFKHWTLQAGLLNGDQFTFGTSYRVNTIRPVKRLARQVLNQTDTSAVPAEAVEPVLSNQARNVLPDYENLSVDTARHQVSYEQRLYRNPFKGMLKLVKSVSGQGVTEFIPLFQGVPIARYQLSTTANASTMSREERSAWTKDHPFNSRVYKFDFRLQPEFIAQFGFRERPIESKTNVLVQNQLYLSRGLVLNWGVLLPIVNHLDNQSLNVRPAPTYLNQFLALDGKNFMSLSAGLFYNDQYGLNVQYRHASLTSRWSWGLESSLTGFYFFPPSDFYYESLKNVMLIGDVAYRIPKRDITVKLSGGQFLFQDRGARIDLIRQLGNIDVGLYALKTVNGATAGFNFAIPIPPGRIVQSSRFRLRSTEEFRWEYAYSRGYNIGTRYNLGYQLDALLRQYHQSYLQNQYRY